MKNQDCTKKVLITLAWLTIVPLAWQPAHHLLEAVITPCLTFLGQSQVDQIGCLQALLGTMV